METKVTYDSLCENFRNLCIKAEKAVKETLNNRNIESINVKAYMDNDLVDYYTFPQTDKNGYGVNTRIDTIVKNEKGEWVANMLDESDDDWDTLELTSWNFDASSMIDILGIIEGIFAVADDDYNGKVLGAGEDFEEK